MFFTLNRRDNPQSDWEPCHEFHWTDPKEAAAYCKGQNDAAAYYGRDYRYRVRKVVDTDDDNFYAREAAKNHKPLPWSSDVNSTWPWRLAHVDPENERQVRFFRSIEDAVCGKYTTINMSRFLANYEDMDDEEAQEILIKNGYYGDIQFGITNDPDKIIDIYNNGPTSCMNDPDEYELPEPHPAIVYSEGDFALAYLGSEGRYTARAVVCKENMTYYNIYGHDTLMRDHLRQAGYAHQTGSSTWNDMRVKAIPYEYDTDEFLMPYIDFCEYGYASECGKFIHLTNSYDKGEYCVRTTMGYTERD